MHCLPPCFTATPCGALGPPHSGQTATSGGAAPGAHGISTGLKGMACAADSSCCPESWPGRDPRVMDHHFHQEWVRHALHFWRLAARFPPRRERVSVATWTVLVEDRPVGWASALRWREQPRPKCGTPPETVPEPFRGNTLEDRHPHEPAAVYNKAECRLLCPVCGVPELHRPTHLAGALHQARVAADWARRAAPSPAAPSAAPRPLEVAEAIRVLRQLRPDLLRDPAHEEAILDLDL
ncbi:uncharacterized protein LOC115328039 isoform X2 [Ixodes scapularis]|nr:uncharacterized protein LOC115328039 isoform X2 [Ixodes scapularis]